jgi:molecular chaperone DnaK
LALRHEVPVHIPFLAADGERRWDLEATLTRPVFSEITEELFQRLELPLKQALNDSGLQTSDLDHALLVGGASRMPGIEDVVVRTLGSRPRRDINPDEAIALGAAVQAGVLGGLVKDQLLLDVTPASLSIETMGGLTTTLIPRNTTIPTRKSEIFGLESDGHTSVEVHVVQGERTLARDNRSVGRLVLRDIGGQMSAGTVEVTLDIDANGLLNVSAKDHATGRDAQARLVPWTGMTHVALADLQKQLPRIADRAGFSRRPQPTRVLRKHRRQRGML